MLSTSSVKLRITPVVEWGKRCVWGKVFVFVCLIACSAASLGPLPQAWAAEDSSEGTVTSNITDVDNRLGSDIGEVSDAIDEVKKQTGVTLNLLYTPSFGDSTQPEKWATERLKESKPKKNTVFLAVASESGSLVVVVSQNSDEWLKSKATVDSLSQAALGPLVNESTPDWAGSATALATQIEAEKKTSQSAPVRTTWIIVFGAALLLIAALTVYFVVRSFQQRKKNRKHAKKRTKTNPQSALRKHAD